eukprot:2123906-Amphidinium_carterae.1
MQVSFIVANVQSALLGLPHLNKNKVTFHTGVFPYIEKHKETTGHVAWNHYNQRCSNTCSINCLGWVLQSKQHLHGLQLQLEVQSVIANNRSHWRG